MDGLSWFFALCGFSFAIGAYVEIEKVKKENIKMRARITNLEDECINNTIQEKEKSTLPVATRVIAAPGIQVRCF